MLKCGFKYLRGGAETIRQVEHTMVNTDEDNRRNTLRQTAAHHHIIKMCSSF